MTIGWWELTLTASPGLRPTQPMRTVEWVALFGRLRGWLFAPTQGEPDADELVELTRFPMRLNAELLVNQLELHGIRAVLYAADAGGWAPHLGMVQGNRVMVVYRDYPRAQGVLERAGSDDG